MRGVRIGFPDSFFFEHLHEDVDSAVRGAIARAESLGAVSSRCGCPISRR
jgi:aspartyl-tRNA(Asn)/glutamyl-tRNA(Gln) amidotransferase subunit A